MFVKKDSQDFLIIIEDGFPDSWPVEVVEVVEISNWQ